MALGRVSTIIGIVIVGVLLAALIALPLIDWNDHRGWIAKKVSERTGRAFAINGDLDIKLGTTPRIRAEQVTLGNAEWGSRPAMVSADAVEFSISVPKLVFGQVFIPDIKLVRPDVLLEKNANAAVNWQFGPAQAKSGGGKPPIIGALSIEAGRVRYLDREQGTDIVTRVATQPATTPRGEPTVTLDATGKYLKSELTLTGRVGALLALRDARKPYPLKLDARVGATRASVDGTVTDVTTFSAMDMRLDMKGNDLAKLYAIIDVPFPPTPPYTLTGRLTRKAALWQLHNLRGTIGDSDVAGDLAVDTAPERTKITTTLVSKRLDFDDIAGFIGAPPQTGPGETAAPAQKREAAKARRRTRALPDKPFNLKALRKVDAQVDFTAQRVRAPSLPIESIVAKFRLENGELRFTPLKFGVAAGEIESELYLNARADPMQVVVDATARRIALAKLFPKSKLARDSAGRFGGRMHIKTRGNAVASMAANADGAVAVAMNTGEVSSLLVSLAGLDVANALRDWLGGDKEIPIRCAVADFTVADGLMQAKTLVFDTSKTKFTGTGSINLDDEALGLEVKANPKGRSLLRGRSPLLIGGTFKNPEVGVEKGKLAGQVAGAAALAAAAPLAALIPLVETGDGKNSHCAALIAGVQQSAEDKTGARAPIPGKPVEKTGEPKAQKQNGDKDKKDEKDKNAEKDKQG